MKLWIRRSIYLVLWPTASVYKSRKPSTVINVIISYLACEYNKTTFISSLLKLKNLSVKKSKLNPINDECQHCWNNNFIKLRFKVGNHWKSQDTATSRAPNMARTYLPKKKESHAGTRGALRWLWFFTHFLNITPARAQIVIPYLSL